MNYWKTRSQNKADKKEIQENLLSITVEVRDMVSNMDRNQKELSEGLAKMHESLETIDKSISNSLETLDGRMGRLERMFGANGEPAKPRK